MKNIIDVKGYLRQRRLREAEEAGERIYRRFISNTLDTIYLEPNLKPCCANSWGIEVVHVGRPEGESEYDHQYCLGLSENLLINELFVGDRFGYEQTLDGTLHFRVIEFEDTDAVFSHRPRSQKIRSRSSQRTQELNPENRKVAQQTHRAAVVQVVP